MAPTQKVNETPDKKTKSSSSKQMRPQEAIKANDTPGFRAPKVSIGRLSPAPPGFDMFVHNSAILASIKKNMAPWLWKTCNEDIFVMPDGKFISVKEHQEIMGRAVTYVRKYPARPAQPLPPSETVDALRAVLDSAPRYHESGNYSESFHESKGGLQYIGEEEDEEGYPMLPNHAWAYDWEEDFRSSLFEALQEVIDAHGMGEQGWEAVRWEVYDKVSRARVVMRSMDIDDAVGSARTPCSAGCTTTGDSRSRSGPIGRSGGWTRSICKTGLISTATRGIPPTPTTWRTILRTRR